MSHHLAQRSWVQFLLISGLFLIFGYGKLFEPGPPYDDPLGGADAVFEYAQIASIPIGLCLILGLNGFYPFYRYTLGGVGKLGWFLMSFGGFAILMGALIYIPTRQNIFWTMLLLGNFMTAFGLIFVGVAAYRKRFLPKWGWSPLVVGLLYTGIFILGSLLPTYEADLVTGVVIFLVTSLGWVLFGIALREGAITQLATQDEMH
jgi:hypothetical protein